MSSPAAPPPGYAALFAAAPRMYEALKAAEHATSCASSQRTIHREPCPFWTKQYCLMESCVHGTAMKDPCNNCGSGSVIDLPADWIPCGSAPCDCFKSVLTEIRGKS